MDFVIKARTAKNKSLGAVIDVEEFQPLTTGLPVRPAMRPWFLNSDSTLLNYLNDHTAHRTELGEGQFRGTGRKLHEVVVTAARIIRDSKNLNGSGADQIIGPETLEEMRGRTLGDILKEKVENFTLGYFSPLFDRPITTRLEYVVNGKKVMLIIDGVDIEKFYTEEPGASRTAHSDYLKLYLDQISAEDIRGIEVMRSSDFNMTYGMKYLKGNETIDDYVFLEITTRSGNGAFIKNIPGLALYRPLPISWPRQFYRPRYDVKDSRAATFTDRRSTIHWEPDVQVIRGKSKLSFYAADRAGTYTVIIQGRDANGHPGYRAEKIVIGTEKEPGAK